MKTDVECGKGTLYLDCFRGPEKPKQVPREMCLKRELCLVMAANGQDEHFQLKDKGRARGAEILHVALSTNLFCLCFELQTELIIYY